MAAKRDWKQYNGFAKPKRQVDLGFLHCSATDHEHHDNPQTMHDWHVARKWSEVGYHYFISKDGTIWICRDIEKTPAAQGGKTNRVKAFKGRNKGTIAICVHGLKKENFTDAQYDALRRLVGDIDKAYDGAITWHGHIEVAYKACPVFDYKAVLGLDAGGRLTDMQIGPASDTETAPSMQPIMEIMELGDRGFDVEKLQEKLQLMGYSIKADGDFGTKTENAVRGFQRLTGLKVDGVVGPKTIAALNLEVQRKLDDRALASKEVVEAAADAVDGGVKSKTNLASGLAGSAAVIAVGDQVADQVQSAGAITEKLFSVGLPVLCMVVAVAAVAFVIYDRNRKAKLSAKALQSLGLK